MSVNLYRLCTPTLVILFIQPHMASLLIYYHYYLKLLNGLLANLLISATHTLNWENWERERQRETQREEVMPGEWGIDRCFLHTPPQASASPSCSPRWPSAVSGHHLCAVALPANHTHCDVSNLRHTTSESTPQGTDLGSVYNSTIKVWIGGSGNWQPDLKSPESEPIPVLCARVCSFI